METSIISKDERLVLYIVDIQRDNDPYISRVRLTFKNGRGVSIVRGRGTYGARKGLYELGVLDGSGGLDYTTPITDDVLGYLTFDEALAIALQVAQLPSSELGPFEVVDEEVADET